MKLFSRMLSKKNEPEESAGGIDLNMDVEPLRRREAASADDTGDVNASKRPDSAEEPLFATPKSKTYSRDIEPDPAPDPAPEALAESWNDDDWDDEDWEDDDEWEDDPVAIAAVQAAQSQDEDKAHLVDEIREAMGAVSHIQPDEPKAKNAEPHKSELRNWAEDEEFGRRAVARSQLNSFAGDAEDRILAETNSHMTDRETSRRRSAMAHLKAAAAATKADAVLKHVVGRDPSGDPEEQSPYRDDLAKVVRPRTTSRPISRPVSRPRSESIDWTSDEPESEDALFDAAADVEDAIEESTSFEEEFAAAEAERLARAPVDLSEDEFSDDSVFGASYNDEEYDDLDEETSLSVADNLSNDEAGPVTPETKRTESKNIGLTFEGDDFPEAESRLAAFRNDVEDSLEAPDPDSGTTMPEKNKLPEPEPENFIEVSAPVSGRSGRSAGRVKTRLLGFQSGDAEAQDIFAATAAKAAKLRQDKEEALNVEAVSVNYTRFPSGWIVVVDGPGRGACFTTFSGVSQIGRGEDQAVRLDFGDTSISRNNHAAIAYDDEQAKFFLGHGGKSNLVRLNGRPVLSTEELSNGDKIRIGETTLKFVALCCDDFVWNTSEGDDAHNAANA